MAHVSHAHLRRPHRAHRAGASAVEFALVGPLLIIMLMGMVVYGSWLWMAQSVQSLASESARAAVGGLDAREREDLARRFVSLSASDGLGIDVAATVVTVHSDAEVIRVRVAYDVHDHPVMRMAVLIPAPPPVIERSAVVRIGGY